MQITDKIIQERKIKVAESLGIVIRINALTWCLQWTRVVLPYLQVYMVLLFEFHAFPKHMGPVQCIVLIAKLLREKKLIPSHFKQNKTAKPSRFSVLLQKCTGV